jgi:hypothetical protein
MTDARSFRYRCARGDARHTSTAAGPVSVRLGPTTPRAIVSLLWDQIAVPAGLPRWRSFPRVEAEQALDRLTQHAAPVLRAALAAYVSPHPAGPVRPRGAHAFCRAAEMERAVPPFEDRSPLGWAGFVARPPEIRR